VTLFVYILLCLIWGSTWLAIKIGLSEAPPFTTAALRFILATSILWGISFAKGYTYPKRPAEVLRLGYPGVYMFGASFALVYFGQQYINTATGAVLFASYPFFVAAFAWLLYRLEKLRPLAWVGMILGFTGVVLISYDSLQASEDVFLGTILVVAAAATAAYGIVIHRHRFNDVNIVVAANVQMITGGVFLVAGALLFESWSDFQVSVASIGSIIYLATCGTVVTFLGYYWLLKRARVTVVALIAFITPVVAILIGVLVADETLTPLIIVGSVLTLLGVLLVVRK
jgi:drug/metabolite transporter (DMT)-like permease